jgi:hypothetical protein
MENGFYLKWFSQLLTAVLWKKINVKLFELQPSISANL